MKLSTRQLVVLAALCTVLLCIVIWAIYAEYNRPWRTYQQRFRQLVPAKSAQDNPEGIRQIWNQELGTADRCVTCHEGIDDPLFINARQPFKTHSGNYLKRHPVEKFGCVICHEGQGPALTADAAHGEVGNWTRPVLRGAVAQSSCMKCHDAEQILSISAGTDEASALINGWKLFQQYNCTGCHRLSEVKKPARIGPALTFIGDKVNRTWLVSWFKDPGAYRPGTKMPRFTISDEESGYMADYLLSLKSPHPPSAKGGSTPIKPLMTEVESLPLEKGDAGGFAVEGRKLFGELGCPGCHRINGNGNEFAPDLSDIGNKVNPGWLIEFLKNPRAYDPKSIMPDLMIAEEDIKRIADYLVGAQRAVLLRFAGPAGNNIDKGRRLVKGLGCTGCHEIEKLPSAYHAPELDTIGDKRVDVLAFGNIKNIKKTLKDWMLVKVTAPGKFSTDKIVTLMPYYDFNNGQAEALVTYLLSLRKDTMPPEYKMAGGNIHNQVPQGRDLIEKYNCLGCHKIENTGGAIGPDLTMEGKKSRPEWLFTFLKRPHKIRPLPMLKAGMPNFNLPDSEVTAIIEYLLSVSKETYPYNFEPKKEIGPEDVWNGEKLYQEIFACSGCHSIDGHGGQVGPDHTDLASRLKRDWIRQWLQNPQAIKPDVCMPRFKFRDWEFEALTDYLMTLGKNRFVDIKSTN
ncbi:MAG: c-type cytochrome [Nitrospirae bacterium]|nr:c-type cytochrome [Nitrospirota bacterium]